MHCHQIFSGTNGTSSLIRHLTSCIPATQKRPKMQEHTSLPFTQKSKIAASSDLKQKKLSFLPSSQKKCEDTEVTTPEQELVLPDIPTGTNRKNPDVDQNGSHVELAAPEQKNHSLPDISTDNNRKNLSTEEIMLPEQMVILLTLVRSIRRLNRILPKKNLSRCWQCTGTYQGWWSMMDLGS